MQATKHPQVPFLDSRQCPFCHQVLNQLADSSKHCQFACPNRQPFLYHSRGAQTHQILGAEGLIPLGSTWLRPSIERLEKRAQLLQSDHEKTASYLELLRHALLDAVHRSQSAQKPALHELKLTDFSNIGACHNWLQQQLQGHNFNQDGILHIRFTDYAVPPAVQQYLQLGIADTYNWDFVTAKGERKTERRPLLGPHVSMQKHHTNGMISDWDEDSYSAAYVTPDKEPDSSRDVKCPQHFLWAGQLLHVALLKLLYAVLPRLMQTAQQQLATLKHESQQQQEQKPNRQQGQQQQQQPVHDNQCKQQAQQQQQNNDHLTVKQGQPQHFSTNSHESGAPPEEQQAQAALECEQQQKQQVEQVPQEQQPQSQHPAHSSEDQQQQQHGNSQPQQNDTQDQMHALQGLLQLLQMWQQGQQQFEQLLAWLNQEQATAGGAVAAADAAAVTAPEQAIPPLLQEVPDVFLEALIQVEEPGALRALYAPLVDIRKVIAEPVITVEPVAASQQGKKRTFAKRSISAPAFTAGQLCTFMDEAPTVGPAIKAHYDEWEHDDVDEVQQGDWSSLPPWRGSNLSFTDGGLAGRAKTAMLGLSVPVGILSTGLTSALMHPEDAAFSSFNLMLWGYGKVWYSVPHRNHQRFLAWLTEQLGPQAVGLCAIKTLLPLLPADVVREFEVQRIVQQPGELILTAPGLTFHYTLSLGSNLAESTNFMPKLTEAQQQGADAAADDLQAKLAEAGAEQQLADILAADADAAMSAEGDERIGRLYGLSVNWLRYLAFAWQGLVGCGEHVQHKAVRENILNRLSSVLGPVASAWQRSGIGHMHVPAGIKEHLDRD